MREPEVALWRAVIMQAITDACETEAKYTNKDNLRIMRFERRQAQSWLLGRSDAFGEVCFMAGLDPDAVYAKAEALAEAGWPELHQTRHRHTMRKTLEVA